MRITAVKFNINKRVIILLAIIIFSLSSLILIYNAKKQNTRGQTIENNTMSIDAWLVNWDQEAGFNDIKNNTGLFNEISPFWYQFTGDPAVKPFPNAVSEEVIEYAHTHDIKIIPTIRDSAGISPTKIINNSTLRKQHIDYIVNMTVEMNYDGIEIDYETLNYGDRGAFTTFISELGSSLHSENKVLIVCATAKTSEPGDSGSSQSQDWGKLGETCDYVRIMCYGYGLGNSVRAPASWTGDVLKLATSEMSSRKVMLAVPTYGYDLEAGGDAQAVTWTQAMQLAKRYDSALLWDAASETPWFRYTDESGVNHEVWFENSASLQYKVTMAIQYKIGGICIWRLGNDDPNDFNILKNAKISLSRARV